MDIIDPSQAVDPLVGRTLPSGLRILARIGSASEGPLYRAQYSPSGPPVALTVLRPPADPSATPGAPRPSPQHWQRLQRAAEIGHPNVAGLLEVGETPDGLMFAVSELLTGILLMEVLDVRSTLPPAEATDVCLQAAAGLEAAHRVGIAHGDVSPHSILVHPGENDRLLVKLIRFDFSCYETSAQQGPSRAGDEPYASRERRAGSAPDPLDDVFSLGAVLHHLLVGKPPAGRAAASIPRGLRRVVARALAPRGERYASVTAFAAALSKAAAALAKPKRRVPRRPVWLAAGMLPVLVAGTLWWGRNRLREDGDDARQSVELAAVTDSQARSGPLDTAPQVRRDTAPAVDSAALELTSDSTVSGPRQPTSGEPAESSIPGGAPERAAPVAATSAAPPASAAPATSAVPAGSAPPTATPKPAGAPRPRAAPSPTTAGSAPAALSPFRRSHPWAARPDGHVYFRSSCSLALGSADLVYFASEAEADATGRTRSTARGC